MTSIQFDPDVRRQLQERRKQRESKTLEQVTREVREERKRLERRALEQAFAGRR